MTLRTCCALSLLTLAPLAAQNKWPLVWQDEFSGASLDQSKWAYDLGAGGWGNNELETYTDRPENAYLEDGNLVIKAIKDGSSYTSARIKTQGKFTLTYGRIEARIQVPFGQGIWPAFWMLGADIPTAGWPRCGEIDIMENIGKEPATVHGTAHGPGYSGGDGIGAAYSLPAGQRFTDAFHVFAVEWEPNVIRWYVDGQLYHTVTPPAGKTWVFDHPFFILLNVAVGGRWPGNPDTTTTFPQLMRVDYVRVYGRPVIQKEGGVANSGSLQAGFAPGSWVTIRGTGLAGSTREWRADDIVDGRPPTQLDGTSILIDGKPAYISYISPNQVNAQAPDSRTGSVTVQVTHNGEQSDPFQVEARVYDPAFFPWGRYVAARRLDYSAVGPPGLFPGLETVPARPGEMLILWGTGFGPVDPPVPAGRFVAGVSRIVTRPAVTIGGIPAEYVDGALTPTCLGLYQIVVKVPDAAPEGDLAVAAVVADSHTPDGLYLNVGRP